MATAPPTASRAEPLHSLSPVDVLSRLGATALGLPAAEIASRRARFGPNVLPSARPPGLPTLFVRQFASPLIFVLLAAAGTSLALAHLTDAAFIGAVLLLNAVIGTVQERAAQRSAEALRALVAPRARVVRDGQDQEVEAEALVPGDVVLLEPGAKVPADLRLLATTGLEVDEAVLTGESLSVGKDAGVVLRPDVGLADQVNMAHAGTVVMRGRATGVVAAIGVATALGRIASAVLGAAAGRPPLLERMDRFARRLAVATVVAVCVLGAVALARGAGLAQVFLMAVALAVSAIPEGLPVALTVALAIGARRMARRSVIARRLVAVEALGSCTLVASDKTGTLTANELSVRLVRLAGGEALEVAGRGADSPEGPGVAPPPGSPLHELATAAILCNDGFLGLRDGAWAHHGDAVDVALLAMGRELGVARAEAEATWPRVADLPYEPEQRFAATFHRAPGQEAVRACAKGAVERVVQMCSRALTEGGETALDAARAEREAEALAAAGYRVLALASGEVPVGAPLDASSLKGLTYLGVVGMADPLRPEVPAAVEACRRAGVEVVMITGDHPVTARAVARELGLAGGDDEVVHGAALVEAAGRGEATLDALVARARVFARVEPTQKLEIVRALQRAGHFVAVTGDGANDAPALRAAQIGVAMGRQGTDVARESAELVLADDNFASIVAGIEEGRVAYANVRKVVFLLISSGAAEIVLFVLAALAGLPLPLTAVQLLWLNLVTNGIQDVALAFEPAEGGELERPPRPPGEPIVDRAMMWRTVLSAAVMAGWAFAAWAAALAAGWEPARAQSGLLLVMVLFENAQAGNSRSETASALRLNPLRNPILLVGTAAALLLHVAAMHLAGLSAVLGIRPAGAPEWAAALAGAALLVAVMELEKALRRRAGRSRRRYAEGRAGGPGPGG